MASNPSSASAAAGEAPSNSLLKDLKTGGHKTRLTPTPTAVHVRLPSREDIQLEKKAQQVEHMEREMHRRRLTPTTTAVHQRLPSADDIRIEKQGLLGSAAASAGGMPGPKTTPGGSPLQGVGRH